MKEPLNKIEQHRLEKLLWLYCLEAGDEGPCSVDGGDIPSAHELASVLLAQGVDIDLETIEAIVRKQLGISDELAATIETAFMTSPAWLSN